MIPGLTQEADMAMKLYMEECANLTKGFLDAYPY